MKQRGSVVAAILQNGEMLESVYNSAEGADNSAMHELETYMQSIQGRIDVFTNSLQTMWMNLINSDAVKWVVDFGTKLIEIVDNVGALKVALMALGSRYIIKNLDGLLKFKPDSIKTYTQNLNKLKDAAKSAEKAWMSDPTEDNRKKFEDATEHVNKYEEAIKNIPAAADEAATTTSASLGTLKGNWQSFVTSFKSGVKSIGAGLKSLGTQIVQVGKSMLIMYAVTTAIELAGKAIEWVVDKIKGSKTTFEDLNEEYEDLSDQLSNCNEELSSLEDKLDSTNEKIEELLNQGTLSFVEQEELERLQAVSTELERQIGMTKTLQGSLQVASSASALKAGESYLDTSFSSDKSKSEREEEGKEKGKTWGKVIGALIAAVGVIAAGVSGGASLALVGAGMAIGGFAGGAIGGASAGAKYDQEQTVEQAIKSMNMTRDQLIAARDDAYAAYASDPMDSDLIADYQEAANALTVYDENMARHMQQMLEYYNAAIEGWGTLSEEQKQAAITYGDFLDAYSIQMGTSDAKENAINRIFGEEASSELLRVKAALEEMAKNGEKIDLQKAFGGNTAEYQAFAERLYDMGIYVHECEDAFYQMQKAAEEAAIVDFTGIAKDINGIVNAIEGVKNAYNEFLEMGYASPDTMLGLSEYFQRTEELQDLYDQYVGIMMSGTASIAEVREMTAKLIQAYIEDMITIDQLDPTQRSIYVTQLSQLGIQNAEELITDALQRTGLDKIKNATKKYFDELYSFEQTGLGGGINIPFEEKSGESIIATIKEITEQYGIEADAVDNIVSKLQERYNIEEEIRQLQSESNDYNEWANGEGNSLGYNDLDDAIPIIRDKIKNLRNFIDNSIAPHLMAGDYGSGWNVSQEIANQFGLDSTWFSKKEGDAIKAQYESWQKELNALTKQYDEYQKRYEELVKKGKENKWLDDDGNLVEGVDENFRAELTEAQKALDAIDAELEANVTIDYNLLFGEIPVVNTISGITEAIEQYNNALDILNDGLYDGQTISEEYYNSLIEQLINVTVGYEDFFDAIDTTNGYVIKNADLLKKLTNQSRKAQVANVQLAKSNATKSYYNLYRQLREVAKTYGNDLTPAVRKQIESLYDQMTAVQKTIAKYTLLEAELLGATSAFEQFKDAQEADSKTDYIGSATDMVLALGEAFTTAKLGSETAQAAFLGLVPESVYKDLDTFEEKMEAAYKYFTEGPIAQYFDLEFDEDGNITKAEMKLGNMRKFIEDGLWGDTNEDGINIFSGDSWTNFELNQEWLDSLPEGADVMQEIANQMKITKEMAFAFFEAFEEYDGGNLFGENDSFLDQLLSNNFEYKAQKAIQNYANVMKRVANGELSVGSEEYTAAKDSVDAIEDEAVENVLAYSDAMGQITDKQSELAYWQNELKKAQEHRDDRGIEQAKTMIQQITGDLDNLYKIIEEPSEFVIELAAQEAQDDIDKFLDDNKDNKVVMDLVTTVNNTGIDNIENLGFERDAATGKWVAGANVQIDGWEDLGKTEREKILEYVNYLDSQHTINMVLGGDTPTVEETLENVAATLQTIADMLAVAFDLKVDADGAITKVETFAGLWEGIKDKSVTLTGFIKQFFTRTPDEGDDAAGVNGNAHFGGGAYAGGTIGAKNSETALMGELGEELIVRGNRWFTVGEDGAGFYNVKKGDIVFNHKQTAELLKNGRVAGRGKAYASGTGASVSIWPNASSTSQWEGTGYDGFEDESYDLSDALNDAAGAAEDFEDTLDWIAIRMEEYEERISLLNAKMENAISSSDKNDLVDAIIGEKKRQLADYQSVVDSGIYGRKAESYLAGLDDTLQEFARNGALAISSLPDDISEADKQIIEKYREFAALAADAEVKLDEIKTEIRDLAIQRVDNAYTSGSVRATVEASQTAKLQSAVDFDEARGLIAGAEYYAAMMENSSKTIEYLSNTSREMQAEFDAAVESGELIVGSNEYYETLDKLYQVQSEIDQAKIELEDFQNAINEIYWTNFDQLISRFDYLTEYTNGLIDIMSDLDMVSKPDNEDGWSASDVNWTAEGLATLGLHAQEMERAEAKAQMYAEAIADLDAEYAAGHYSESEYYEKLNELTQGQYDAIKAAKDEKEAIIKLNETRVDAIKKGIEKEIDAYSKLIKKQKEALENEKDAYKFQQSISESTKNIADIERKLAALSGDTSSSARAQRAKLEEELAEARAELEEQYYDRSIEDQQDALDRQLEDFTEQKEAQIEQWEKYLEDVEYIIAESLGIVQANADEIGQTLTDKANEYNIKVADAVFKPWDSGMNAISDYTTKFGDFASSTTAQLESIRKKWEEINKEIDDANASADLYYDTNNSEHTYTPTVSDINNQNETYVKAENPAEPVVNNSADSTPSTPGVGSSVTVKSTATHFSSKSKGLRMASFVPGGSYTVYQISGNEVLIGRNGVYTGWVNQHDLVGYAKGTTGVNKDQLALIDELGEELVVGVQNGRLTYLSKGSGVIPADLTSNLMSWGELDPQDMLDRNRPQIVAPHIVNNEINIDCSVGTLMNIEHCDQNTLPDVEKLVSKAFDKHMQTLNNSIRRYTR